MTNTRRVWLTPANAVLALAVMALIVVTSATITQKVLGKEAAPAAAEPPAVVAPVVPEAPAYTVAGKVQLRPGQFVTEGPACRRVDGQVIVTDKAGTSLTYAPLQTGRPTPQGCEVPFTLTVPKGHGSYGVDVPTVGRLTYSEAELANLLDLTIS